MTWDSIYHQLSSNDGSATHSGVLILLLLGGLGFPIPEDIVLVLAGLAAAKNVVSFQSISLTAYLGVLLADLMVFCCGFLFGNWLLNKGKNCRFLPSLTEEKLAEVREGLRKNRLLYILISRHLFPIRSVTFLAAGALRISLWEFLSADAIAALVSVNLMVWMGYLIGGSFTAETLKYATNQIHVYILGFLVLTLIIYFSGRAIKARRKK